MTTNASVEGMQGMEDFHRRLLACVEDISGLLPVLSRRYDMPVIIDAMAEHVGAALQVLLRKNQCTPEQAAQVIKHIEGAAFLGDPAQTKSEEPPDTPPSEEPDR